MQKFMTVEEAEEQGYIVQLVTLKHASCYQAFLPGIAWLGYHPNKDEALKQCSAHNNRK